MNTEVKQRQNSQISIILNKYDEVLKQEESKTYSNPFKIIDQKLSSLIGMDHIKNSLKEIYAMQKINEQREKYQLKTSDQVYHMLFTGNPGTGKTTIARKLANIFYEINVLPKDHIVEVDRSELVGEYIGQTAQKTRSVIKKSLGGVLFIDEAYSLSRGGEKDFGKETIDTLVKYMEDYANEFILILAGYPKEMEYFLSLNPGLKSRFPFFFDFPDYTADELMLIAKQILKEREYTMTREAEWKLKNFIVEEINKNSFHFSNGRFIRNLIEKAMRHHAVRLMKEGKVTHFNELSVLTVKDFQLM